MAWTPPTAPKHTDLGEIPGIRELSDEERAKLEAADPNGGMHSVGKNLEKHREATADDLVNEYGQLAMDIGNFIDDWEENPSEDSPEFNILSETLYADIEERLNDTKDMYGADDVFDIACRRELVPMMFYFGVNIDATTGKPFAVVTRGDWWNNGKILDTDNLARFVVPECLSNPYNSRFDVDPDMSPSELRRELKKNGFIENHEVAGL